MLPYTMVSCTPLHILTQHRDKAYILDGLYLSKPEKKPHGAKFCFILHCPSLKNDRK